MQDPFQTFLGAEPTDASPLPATGMSPGADGGASDGAYPTSPHDAQPVQANAPLAVPAGAPAAPAAVETPSKMKMYLGIGAAVLLGYWLLKGKARSVKINPRRR